MLTSNHHHHHHLREGQRRRTKQSMRRQLSASFFLCYLGALSVFIPFAVGFNVHQNPLRGTKLKLHEGLVSEPVLPNKRVRKPKNLPSKSLSWNERYEQLTEFRRVNGHAEVPRNDKPDWVGLRQFVQRQRMEYSKRQEGEESLLTDEQIERLNNLDFLWDIREVQWLDRRQEVSDFRDKHGHCLLEFMHTSLGKWCMKQRREFKNGVLSQDRIDSLNALGFIWFVLENQFYEGLQELKAFKDANDGKWPRITDGSIGNWYYSRRREYLSWLRGEESPLTESHRLALEEVGFSAALKQRRISKSTKIAWERRFEELVEFKMEHGHTNVARGYGKLGSWVNAQRRVLGRSNETTFKPVQRYRIQMLDEIGFIWNANNWRWDQMFEDLSVFYEENGHTNIPKSAGVLGQWCEVQRVEYSIYERDLKSHLTEQRIVRLNTLCFEWDRGDTLQLEWDLQWDQKFNLLKEYYSEHGNFDVPKSYPILGDWVSKQKNYYRGKLRNQTNSLTEQRIKELDSIGFLDEIKDAFVLQDGSERQ